jgi:hypothetical protein
MTTFRQTTKAAFSRNLSPAGTHLAALVYLVNLGSAPSKFKEQDGTPKLQQLAHLVFELLDVADRPLLSITPTLSFTPGSKLMELLGSWRGRVVGPDEDVDLRELLGKAALVVIRHETTKQGKPFAVIASVAPPMPGMSVPTPQHAPKSYEAGEGPIPPWIDGLPWAFGKSVRAWIEGSSEFRQGAGKNGAPGNEDVAF